MIIDSEFSKEEKKKSKKFHSGYYYIIEPSWPVYLQYRHGKYKGAILSSLYTCVCSLASFRSCRVNGRSQRKPVDIIAGEALWTSLRIIGDRVGLSANTVRKYLFVLHKEGLIKLLVIPGKHIEIIITHPIPTPSGDFRDKIRRSRKKSELLSDLATLQVRHNISQEFIQTYVKEKTKRTISSVSDMSTSGLQKVIEFIRDNCSNDDCAPACSTISSEREVFNV